jgi:hypothetical protein
LGGGVSLERLAAACASQPEAVQIGLQLWEARGELTIQIEGEEVNLTADTHEPDPTAIINYETILKSLLEESRAFRGFFKRSDLQTLIRH